MSVSIVILNWNGLELLEKCVPSVLEAAKAYAGACEIMVVDNGSEDKSLDYLRGFAQVRIISLPRNLGFAAGMNIGIKEAKYPVVIGLNNDVIVDENFIAPLIKHFRKKEISQYSPSLTLPTKGEGIQGIAWLSPPLVGGPRGGVKRIVEGEVFAVASKMLLWDKKTLNFGRAIGNFNFGIFNRAFANPSLSANTLYACAGAFAADKNKFLSLGGFDEDMDVYWEDLDICYRAWKQGYRIIYEPKSVVYHKKHGTYAKKCGVSGISAISGENYSLFLLKNLHDRRFFWQQLFFLPALILATAVSGKHYFTLGILRSIKRWPVFFKKRKLEKERAIFSDRQVLNMSSQLSDTPSLALPTRGRETKEILSTRERENSLNRNRLHDYSPPLVGGVRGGEQGKIRVLQIGKYYDPYIGGTEMHLFALADELKRRPDLELRILVSHTEAKTEIRQDLNLQVIKLATAASAFSVPLSLSMPFWMRRLDSDILHFHLPNPLSVLSYLLARPKGRVVVSYHSDIIRQRTLNFFFKPFLNRFLEKAEVIIISSRQLLENSGVLPRFRDKCVVVPHGIDIQRFSGDQKIIREADEIKKKYGAPLILFVGRLVYYKGLVYLLKAMKDVNARLMVIGSGPLKAKLQRLARRLGLSDKVIWLGAIRNEETPSYYHACDIFVLPSSVRAESFGLVQLEAFACLKPVVSTALPTGVPFVNIHGKTGIVVPPRDAQALAGAINRLLKAPSLAKSYGQNAGERVEKEFTKEKMAERILKIYDELIL